MKKLICYRFLSLLLAGMLVFSTCQKDEDKPLIVLVSPDSGRVGDAVVISGLLLGQATRVVFGTAEGVVIAAESKAIFTQVPAGLPAGKVSVTVETNGGLSNPLEFTVMPSVPEITTIAPLKGSPGMRVMLTGLYFSDTKEVSLGDQKITAFEVSSDTQLVIKIPGNSTLGEKDLTVTTPGGVSKPATFTVVSPPFITSFSPPAGLTGKHILISGANLSGITAVYFQDAAAAFEVKSAALIDAIVPATAATGKLKVVGEGGEALSATDFVVEGAPSIASFTPASGTFTTEVIIDGDNFLPDAKVKFGTIYARTTFVSEKRLKATVPAGASSGPVVVETAAGAGRSDDTFLVIAAPSVDRFSPIMGVAGKTKLTISGANFKDISSVKFNGAEAGQANITVNSLTSLDVRVPELATTGTVTVTNPSGTGVSASIFTVVDPSSALTFSPDKGAVGASITVTGFGFDNTSVVRFNGVQVSPGGFDLNSETSITVQVPASSTTGKISVTTAGLTLKSTQDFTVIQAPVINNFRPASGPVGTQVVVSGSNFDNATVRLNGVTIDRADITSNTNTISFHVPSGASTGPIAIETVAGVVFTGNFTVVPPPQITSFNPLSGAVGSTVTISGSNFDNASSVQFNGTEVGNLNFQVISPYAIAAKVPVGATTGVITVTTPAGSCTSSNNFTVAPVVNSFSPPSGPAGTVVAVSGNNFENITDVFFNGIKAKTFTMKSTTSLEATVPASAGAGLITVVSAIGSGSSGHAFTITPLVTAVRPASGMVGTPVTIDGSDFTGVSDVTFNNVRANFSITNDTQIATTVPQTATSGYLAVSNSAGSSNIYFTVSPAPALTSVTPSTAQVGSHIFLFGSNLTQVTNVEIGGKNALIVSQLPSKMEVVVPQGTGLGRKSIVAYFSVGYSTLSLYVGR
ncbi:hypothetical protein SAMN04488109_1914 [Chryseolinea serpens]|uniref:IPT/TIG domain-containing protein n=1 Tax=Chryseolinea serpens TaxID=947013 RepID=A0A1M5MST3_9BACT|nr:IPT/TIG domain-containing protein [Chryseolinea serpens]SHG80306.1 hypothetical protein SAMN04488109_1914 [Chryseolinea serpens]